MLYTKVKIIQTPIYNILKFSAQTFAHLNHRINPFSNDELQKKDGRGQFKKCTPERIISKQLCFKKDAFLVKR